jgi:hypothetical protein
MIMKIEEIGSSTRREEIPVQAMMREGKGGDMKREKREQLTLRAYISSARIHEYFDLFYRSNPQAHCADLKFLKYLLSSSL